MRRPDIWGLEAFHHKMNSVFYEWGISGLPSIHKIPGRYSWECHSGMERAVIYERCLPVLMDAPTALPHAHYGSGHFMALTLFLQILPASAGAMCSPSMLVDIVISMPASELWIAKVIVPCQPFRLLLDHRRHRLSICLWITPTAVPCFPPVDAFR